MTETQKWTLDGHRLHINTFDYIAPDNNFVHTFRYPAGELQVRLLQPAIELAKAAKTISIDCRITSSDDIMQLALLTNAIRNTNTYVDIVLNLPYMPYSRADRAFTDGDCFGLEVFASVINKLRFAEVRTLDVHNPRTADFLFNGLVNYTPEKLIKLASAITNSPTTCLLPDDGAMKRYADICLPYFNNVVHASKKRNPETGELVDFDVPRIDILERSVLIVDDICDGGGTFKGIAAALRKAGYEGAMYLYVTHGIFSKGTMTLLSDFERIFTTNSFVHGRQIGVTSWDAFQYLNQSSQKGLSV